MRGSLQIGPVSVEVTGILMTDIYGEPSCTPTEWHRQRTLYDFLAKVERSWGPRPLQFIDSDPVRVRGKLVVMPPDLCAVWLVSQFTVPHSNEDDGSELVVVYRHRFRNDRKLIPTRVVQAIEWNRHARNFIY